MSRPRDEAALEADLVIVGSGVAGLSAALAATDPEGGAHFAASGFAPQSTAGSGAGPLRSLRVLLVTPGRLGGDGASTLAQGGIAAALAPGDSPALHALDTHRAGAGLTDGERVEILASEGPARVRELARMGVRFDRDASGALALGLEGAHSRRRIVHALGDRTGWEVTRVLAEAVVRRPSVRILEGVRAQGLLTEWAPDGGGLQVVGVRLSGGAGAARAGRFTVRAPVVLLATGGASHLFQRTTAPAFALGEGIAMARAVGARLEGMEFVQFHPTALRVDADPLPLVTEALRGEGARLVDAGGRVLSLGDGTPLASRDRVARALWAAMEGGVGPFLDAREVVGEAFPRRFPGVWNRCQEHGIDPRRELIPVTPAAHYHMGGIAVDAWGRTSVPGLRAAGEVASSGIHGANRLASNSLLEGLVYGRRAGWSVMREPASPEGGGHERVAQVAPDSWAWGYGSGGSGPGSSGVAGPGGAGSDLTCHLRGGGNGAGGAERAEAPLAAPPFAAPPLPAPALQQLRSLLWEGVGVVRDAQGIRRALEGIGALEATHGSSCAPLVVGRAIAEAAGARAGSLGSHLRRDEGQGERAPGRVGAPGIAHTGAARWAS
jgi:L-aspartate oxidase